MKLEEVPQDDSPGYAKERRAVYAQDADGGYVVAASSGWAVEEAANTLAVATFEAQAQAARARCAAGQGSPLEVIMYLRRMDIPTLAQATGLWAWRVKRHLRAKGYRRLSPALRQRYADALGCDVAQLLPEAEPPA